MLHRYTIDIEERESRFIPKGHVTVTVTRNGEVVFEHTGSLACMIDAAHRAIKETEREERQ